MDDNKYQDSTMKKIYDSFKIDEKQDVDNETVIATKIIK